MQSLWTLILPSPKERFYELFLSHIYHIIIMLECDPNAEMLLLNVVLNFPYAQISGPCI